jgi:hypothetical protein
MKIKILLPIVLLTIIAILGVSLIYQTVQRHRAARGQMQFEVAVFVQLYQNLDRGETDAAKRRLGALVTVQSDFYEKRYGHEADTKFSPMLAQAEAIKSQFETMSK